MALEFIPRGWQSEIPREINFALQLKSHLISEIWSNIRGFSQNDPE